MGNDGGSIPGRKDLVKEKERERKMENNDLVKKGQSKYCVLSKEPLRKPIVGDRLGFLYNKEALINALLDKRLPSSFKHINSLKDVKDLKICFSGEKEDESKIICPISSTEFSGLNNFYFIWKCGCVLSNKAIEELNMKDKCILCNEHINPKTDLVNLNYSKEERQKIFNKIIEEKRKVKELKLKEKELLNKKREHCKDLHTVIKEDDIEIIKKRKIEG